MAKKKAVQPKVVKPAKKPAAKKPAPIPELQVVRNCGACGAAKLVFPSRMAETPCDLCGKIQWV